MDDRVRNFTPQPDNGVHVRSYDDVEGMDWEMGRLLLIILAAHLLPDVRPILRSFRSVEHEQRFPHPHKD